MTTNAASTSHLRNRPLVPFSSGGRGMDSSERPFAAENRFMKRHKGFAMPAAAGVLAILALGATGTWYYSAHHRPLQIARDAVGKRLSDPDSASYRNLTVDDDGLICGEVSAKNRMGGYVGYTPFRIAGGSAFFEVEGDHSIRDRCPTLRR